mgnify:FL=1
MEVIPQMSTPLAAPNLLLHNIAETVTLICEFETE